MRYRTRLWLLWLIPAVLTLVSLVWLGWWIYRAVPDPGLRPVRRGPDQDPCE